MFRAQAAGLLQPFAELLAGAMMPHAQVVGVAAKLAGKRWHRANGRIRKGFVEGRLNGIVHIQPG